MEINVAKCTKCPSSMPPLHPLKYIRAVREGKRFSKAVMEKYKTKVSPFFKDDFADIRMELFIKAVEGSIEEWKRLEEARLGIKLLFEWSIIKGSWYSSIAEVLSLALRGLEKVGISPPRKGHVWIKRWRTKELLEGEQSLRLLFMIVILKYAKTNKHS